MTAQNPNEFLRRHIGPQPDELAEMLRTVGVASLDELIDQTVPKKIRLKKPLKTGGGESEHEFLVRLQSIAAKNKVFKSFIGLGYFDTITPSVILRCVLENPSWYTPYTPYQAEISQGRLEALLNFQTMVKDLAGMDVANASLLDEATAAAEAMAMLHRIHSRSVRRDEANVFFVSDKVHPQTLDVLRSRAEPLGIKISVGQFRSFEFDETVFGALVQNPDADGNVYDIRNFIDRAHSAGVKVAVASDLLACTIITPPGDMGADIVFGSAQRFGVPMGFGGPHAAFFATRNEFVREMPGRIIGVSVDRLGNPAYRMSLQTREQHIRRDKAKSNICTAQALLANIAGFYATFHGPCGLRAIATRIHSLARVLDSAVRSLGARQENPYFFDTVKFILPMVGNPAESELPIIGKLREAALKAKMNFRYEGDDAVIIAIDETTTADDVVEIVGIFAAALGMPAPEICVAAEATKIELNYHRDLVRESKFMTHPVFNSHHSETQMMRYLKMLEKKDLGLDVAMIPLGSCTMKLNAATEMIPVTWPEFAKLHPFVPPEQAKGWAQIIGELETALEKITGFAAVSLQPNAGSQGEYAGLMAIRAFHASRGEAHRNICLIPASAHGTNPASAVMAGFEVVVVACDKEGHVDLADLKAKAEANKEKLAALMVTYPSTYGVFEEGIVEICEIVHANGGQVYMDGANMNAQVGLTSPGRIGADVCHLNLHKTFAIPHGGGGPGMGPIGVAKHLAPFLPGHPVVTTGGEKAIHAVSAAPFGSATVLLISYAYISMLGDAGMTEATKFAILNANYIKARLEKHFEVHYVGSQGRVAHEMIFDLRPLKEKSGIDETDVAKRLMDYGFHAPTVSWPVPGTMMIEPTESEPKCELDRFCDAMIAIRGEIEAVASGEADKLDNVLKNAPHTAAEVCGDGWKHAYPRELAAFPTPAARASKFWPAVARIDNTHGDKNLVCSCPDISNYGEQAATAAV